MTLHRYLYANASPVSFTDPSGEFLVEVMAAISVYSILQAVAIPVSHLYYWGGKRPDDDKILTFVEAAFWWKHGQGKPLTVDLNKIDLSGITISDFKGKTSRGFNTASFEFYSGLNTGLVYGSLGLTISSGNVVYETDGFDDYDFNIDHPFNSDLFIRNVETAGGAVLHGPGKPFRINITGTTTLAY